MIYFKFCFYKKKDVRFEKDSTAVQTIWIIETLSNGLFIIYIYIES
jgi:hypothetical protein